jgi:hypothetical protein
LISIEQRHEIQRLKESGEIAKASQFLKDLVYNKELTLESTEDLSELCLLYIKQSRYQEAYEQGLLIQRLVNIRQQSSLRVLVAALTFAIFSFVDVSWVQKLGRMLSLNLISYKGIRKVNYKTFDGILWGVYWQDMKQALKMNVLCAVTATSETDRVKGYAFLYYTHLDRPPWIEKIDPLLRNKSKARFGVRSLNMGRCSLPNEPLSKTVSSYP